jgi:hypothetical protein
MYRQSQSQQNNHMTKRKAEQQHPNEPKAKEAKSEDPLLELHQLIQANGIEEYINNSSTWSSVIQNALDFNKIEETLETMRSITAERERLLSEYKELFTEENIIQRIALEIRNDLPVLHMSKEELLNEIELNKNASIKEDVDRRKRKLDELLDRKKTIKLIRTVLKDITGKGYDIFARVVNERKILILTGNRKCPHSGNKHKKAEDNRQGFYICSKIHNIFEVRSFCGYQTCKASSSIEQPVVVEFRISGNKVYQHRYDTELKRSIKSKVTDDVMKRVLRLQEKIFPEVTPWMSDFPIQPLGHFKQSNYYGMTYETYNSKYAKPFSFNKNRKTIALICHTGGGKTTRTVETVLLSDHLFNGKDILVISPRRSLTMTIKSKFLKTYRMGHYIKENGDIEYIYAHTTLPEQDLIQEADGYKIEKDASLIGMKAYLDIDKGNYATQPRLIISPDSSVHLCSSKIQLRNKALVWIDEFESWKKYCADSSTLDGERARVWNIMTQLIKSSEYFLATDAHITSSTLKLLSMLRNTSTTTVYHNTYRTNPKQYICINNTSAGEQKLMKDIKEGKNVYVFCDTRKQALALKLLIEKHYSDTTIIYYDRDSSDIERETIFTCDTSWKTVRVVITTPVIIYGVDFSEVHFHRTYCFITGNTVDAQSIVQASDRARTLIDNKVFLVCDVKRPEKPLSLQQVESLLTTRHEDFMNTLKSYSFNIDDYKPISLDVLNMLDLRFQNGFMQLSFDDPFTLIVRDTLYNSILSKSDIIGWISAYIVGSGGRFYTYDASRLLELVPDKPSKKQKELLIQKYDEATADLVGQCTLLSDEDYAHLKRKKQKDSSDMLKMRRYQISNTYGSDDLSVEFILSHGSEEARRKFITFSEFCLDEETQHIKEMVKGEDDSILTRSISSNSVSFKYINEIMTMLGIKVNIAFEVLANEPVEEKVQTFIGENKDQMKHIFGDCARYRGEFSKHRVVQWLCRLIKSIMPEILTSDKRQKVSTKPLLYRYMFKWNTSRYIDLVYKRFEYHMKIYPLKDWALKTRTCL